MQIDRVKRDLVYHSFLHHDHPCHPEEQNIRARDKHICREVALHLVGVFGPAKCTNRPEARREPRVENIRVACKRFATRLFKRLCLCCSAVMGAFVIIPNWDLMAPPELTGDAPRLDIFQPVIICFLTTFRHDLDLAIAHSIQRRTDHFLSIDKPLICQHRLDHHFGAIAKRLHDGFVLDIGDKPGLGLAIFIFKRFRHHHGQTLGRDLLYNSLTRRKTV